MKKKITDIFCLVCAVGVCFLTFIFWTNRTPIEVEAPEFSVEDLQKIAVKTAETKQAEQKKRTLSKIERCKTNDDCIIVDRDLCGCSIGPKGVTAINVNYSAEFAQMLPNKMAKTCPDTLSTERECSPTARAVCQQNQCKIIY